MAWEDIAEGVWLKDTGIDGPTVAIFGAIHGDEQAGGIVVKEDRNNWPIDAGRVVAFLGNPRAFEIGERHTGETPASNLNRNIRPLDETSNTNLYEVRKGQEIKGILDLLKVKKGHDMHEHDTKNSDTTLIICKGGIKIAKDIRSDYISWGWADEQGGSTDAYIASVGGEAHALEAGWKGATTANIPIHQQGVRRFLFTQGLTDQRVPPLAANPKYLRLLPGGSEDTEPSFQWKRAFKQMEEVKPGEIIAVNGGHEFIVPDVRSTVRIIFPDDSPELGAEFCLLAEEVPDPTLAA